MCLFEVRSGKSCVFPSSQESLHPQSIESERCARRKRVCLHAVNGQRVHSRVAPRLKCACKMTDIPCLPLTRTQKVVCTELLLRITLHGRHVFRRDPVLSRVWHLDAELLQPLQPLIWPSPPAPPGRSAPILLKAVRLDDSQRVSTLHPKLMPPSSFNFTSKMAFNF